jgi:hypothetical protein
MENTIVTEGAILWLPETPTTKSIPNFDVGALKHYVLVLSASTDSDIDLNVQILIVLPSTPTLASNTNHADM